MAALISMRRLSWGLLIALSQLTYSCSERSLQLFESGAAEAPPTGVGATGGTGASGPSGTGSTSGTGGVSGMGGVPGTGATAGAAGGSSVLLIDDFEDGDGHAVDPAGWWYPVDDGTSSQTMLIEQDATRQSLALHTAGAGFTDWGAALGVDLAEVPVDATMRALRFSARAAANRDVAVQFIDDAGTRFTHNLTVTPNWQEHAVRLDQLYTPSGDSFVPLDVTSIDELHLFFFGSDSFDLWIDDVVIETE